MAFVVLVEFLEIAEIEQGSAFRTSRRKTGRRKPGITRFGKGDRSSLFRPYLLSTGFLLSHAFLLSPGLQAWEKR